MRNITDQTFLTKSSISPKNDKEAPTFGKIVDPDSEVININEEDDSKNSETIMEDDCAELLDEDQVQLLNSDTSDLSGSKQ